MTRNDVDQLHGSTLPCGQPWIDNVSKLLEFRHQARSLFCIFATALLLSACGGLQGEESYPERQRQNRYDPVPSGEERESIFGPGGIGIFGGDEETTKGGGGIGVNSFLWRATLDTLAFMPLASADPFGGVIITDWFQSPNQPNERFKLTVYILDRRLRADGIKVSVFRQERDASGVWQDVVTNPQTAVQVENAILTRARQLRIDATGAG